MGRTGSEGAGPGAGADVRLPPLCGFIPSTLIDWEGKIAAEIFLCGCNFRCPFCHSAHLVFGKVERLDWGDIATSLSERRAWLDGVVISGGEPTIHGEALFELCRRIKQTDLSVKVDTNGTAPDILSSLHRKGLLDFVALDLKAPLDERYTIAAGVPCDPSPIRQTLQWLISGEGPPYEIRTTVVPRLHDYSTLEEMAEAIKGAAGWVLQNFNPKNGCLDTEWQNIEPYSEETLREWARRLSAITPCRVRGLF